MAPRNQTRTPEEIRREIETEREQLADAVDGLREGIGAAADIRGKLASKLPVVAAGALAGGFVLAGGIGATARLLMRRGREGTTKTRFGPFALVERD